MVWLMVHDSQLPGRVVLCQEPHRGIVAILDLGCDFLAGKSLLLEIIMCENALY